MLEDCAQAQGARYHDRLAGSIGDAGSFSFYPTKLLGGYGDGGAVVSRHDAVLTAGRMLRFYGMEATYYAERHGYNSRLDEVQAAILALKLPTLDQVITRRRQSAERYTQGLAGSAATPVGEQAYNKHVYHLYVVEVNNREEMMEAMTAANIGTGVCYKWPIHTMRGYAHLGYQPQDLPVTMEKASRIMNLPLFQDLSDESVDRVIEVVRRHAR